MATLIKLCVPPQKHLLKKSLAITQVNCVLSLDKQLQKAKHLDLVDDNIALARAMTKNFCEERGMIERKSFVRGEKRAEMQLINEIFVIYARLLRGFSDEAVAIEKLAHRIAANITDQTDLPMAKHHPCIEASLKAMIRLTIEAPALHIAALREEVDKLAHKLDIPIILELSLGNAAQLSFNVLGNNSSLAVNAERLLPILKNINNRFKLV